VRHRKTASDIIPFHERLTGIAEAETSPALSLSRSMSHEP
jgi:hypothetical protein